MKNHSSLTEANKNKFKHYPPTKLGLELKREITKTIVKKLNEKRIEIVGNVRELATAITNARVDINLTQGSSRSEDAAIFTPNDSFDSIEEWQRDSLNVKSRNNCKKTK